MNSLQPEIKNWVQLLSPETRLSEGSHMTPHPILKFSSNGRPTSSGSKPSPNQPQTHSPYDQHTTTTPPPPSSLSLNPNQPPPTQGFRHLTRTKHDEHRLKGLCFKYDQLFSPQHKCLEGNLQVLLLGDDDDEDDIEEIFLTNQDPKEEEPKGEGECQILDLMGLFNNPNLLSKTLKLQGDL